MLLCIIVITPALSCFLIVICFLIIILAHFGIIKSVGTNVNRLESIYSVFLDGTILPQNPGLFAPHLLQFVKRSSKKKGVSVPEPDGFN